MSAGSTLITGGRLFDGLGQEPYAADLLIDGGRIVMVSMPGSIVAPRGADVTDASGLDVLPGFVDVHSHDDAAIFRHGGVNPKLRQGVTTTIIGNCGHGCAPSSGKPLEDYSTPVLGPFPDRSWATFADYFADAAEMDLPINVAGLVPHAPIRSSVMGMVRRPADTNERNRIIGAMADALEAGAAGVSFGLMYSPGNAADRAELEGIAKVVARADKLLVAHIRNEADLMMPSLDEFASLAEATGVSLHISHLKVTGPKNFGNMPAVIDRLDAFRSAGIDVTADVYPYDAGSTTVATLFPSWSTSRGVESLLTALRDPHQRAKVLHDLRNPWVGESLENYFATLGPDAILLAGFQRDENSHFEGRSIADIAAAVGADPAECLAELVLAESGTLTVVLFQTDIEGMVTALQWPHTLIGSDGLPRESGYVHPRLFGTFSRVLSTYAGPGKPLSMVEAVARMSAGAARRFCLTSKLGVAPGMDADLQLIDPRSYLDLADFTEPRQHPSGVELVLVHGTPIEVGGGGQLARVMEVSRGIQAS